MLARGELAAIARRQGVPFGVVEWDYVQHLLLRHVASAPFAFKGGTCIRIAYGSPRYSEDIDFDGEGSADDLFGRLTKGAERLRDYGIPAEVARGQGAGLEAKLHYEGPLFDGTPQSRGSIRIDVSLRGERVDVEEVFAPSTPYADVPQLVVRALTGPHLLSEKVRALIVRGKARDLYDLHFLLERGVTCRRALLDEKMRLYRRKFTRKALDASIVHVRRSWSRDLEVLLGSVPPFETVAAAVRERVRRFEP